MKPCKCGKPRYGSASLCRTHYFEKQRAKVAERKVKKQQTKKFQKSELKKWRAKTWKLMSEYVRRKDADFAGYTTCYTCKKKLHWKEAHAGHYQHNVCDLDERNLKPQCPACNTYHGGRLDSYTMNLIADYGLEWVETLRKDAAQHPGYSIDVIKQKYAELKLWTETNKS